MKPADTSPHWATIESIDHEGRGVAHVDGKVIFIDGALTFERVRYNSYRRKPDFELAQVTQIKKPSFMRVEPGCPHFGVCGGCSMQHLEAGAQVAAKQRVLEDNLSRIGKVRPQHMLPAIYGPTWGYRHRARLSARWVEKKGGMLVGFHERKSSFIADMIQCKVLPQRISALLPALRVVLGSLSIFQRVAQVELAVGERVDVLVLRNLEPLGEGDFEKLDVFARAHQVQFWLQPGGPDTAYPLCPVDAPALSYTLPEYDIELPFKPTEFTQVNPAINRILVSRAIKMLDIQPGERIADMFCGLGNFTLPMARLGAQVLGMEGSAALVARAKEGAVFNGLADKLTFAVANLFEMTPEQWEKLGPFDKMLIDPPRDGAVELVRSLTPATAPRRIVYVSCNPATLARDAGILVHVQGYRMVSAGVVNMFPHTAHVESIALFERDETVNPSPELNGSCA